LPCIICGKRIEPSCGKAVEWLPCTHRTNADHSSYSNGVVGTIEAGYGSIHDTTKYTIAICDKCINKNVGKRIFNIGSFMPPSTAQVKVDWLIEEWSCDRSRPRKTLAEYLHLTGIEYDAFVNGELSYEWVWEFYNERKT